MSGDNAKPSNPELDKYHRDLKTARHTSQDMRTMYGFYPVQKVVDLGTERDFDIFAELNSKCIEWVKTQQVHGGNAKKNLSAISISVHDIAAEMWENVEKGKYGDSKEIEGSVFDSQAVFESLGFLCVYTCMGKFSQWKDKQHGK